MTAPCSTLLMIGYGTLRIPEIRTLARSWHQESVSGGSCVRMKMNGDSVESGCQIIIQHLFRLKKAMNDVQAHNTGHCQLSALDWELISSERGGSGVRYAMSISVFIKRHPVLTYFVLTFAISTGCILILVGRGGMPIDPRSVSRRGLWEGSWRSWAGPDSPCRR